MAENPLTMVLVVLPLAGIEVAVPIDDPAFAMPESVLELAFVYCLESLYAPIAVRGAI